MKNEEEKAVDMPAAERTEYLNACAEVADRLSSLSEKGNNRRGFMLFAIDRGAEENEDAKTGVILAMNGSQQVLANALSAALKHTDLDSLLTDVMLHRLIGR